MMVREGFRKMLDLEDDLEVVGEAKDAVRRSCWPKNFGPMWC
jgi:DNA-binding NarL/FixJ family response regulator